MTSVQQPAPPIPLAGQIALWQLNLLRVGYLVMGGGLAVYKWPLLFADRPWGLAQGTVECLLVAMSVLALLVSPCGVATSISQPLHSGRRPDVTASYRAE